MTVIKFMPYAVICIACEYNNRRTSSNKEVVWFIVVLYLSIIIVFIIHLIIIAMLGLNPCTYVKKAMEPLILKSTLHVLVLVAHQLLLDLLTDKIGVDQWNFFICWKF